LRKDLLGGELPVSDVARQTPLVSKVVGRIDENA